MTSLESFEKRTKIIDDHPHLYPNGIHIECDNGWLDIISDLSDKLEIEIKNDYEKYHGSDDYIPMYATQIKEKYGELRFYMNVCTAKMYELIDQAEALSAKTCEICGMPAKTRKGCWRRTLCDLHYQTHMGLNN